MVESHFSAYIIDNGVLFTFWSKDSEDEPAKNVIAFPPDFDALNAYSFRLRSVRSLLFYAGMGGVDGVDEKEEEEDDEEEDEVSPERRAQVFNLILRSVLSISGFKWTKSGASRGWFPANSNRALNRVDAVYKSPRSEALRDLGVLRGFRASLCVSVNGLALKVSNTNRIIHSQSLQQEMRDLYEADPARYHQNVRRFIGRRAWYLPNQSVVEIAEIKLEQNEESRFSKKVNGERVSISHRDNLLDRNMATFVSPEEHGLVADEWGYSFDVIRTQAPHF